MTDLLVIEHEADTGLGRLQRPLAATLELVVRRPYLGDPVPTDARAAGYAGVVVLGGVPGAWDDQVAPWLPDTRTLLATAVDQGVPVLGICLGAQLLAAACGGEVGRGGAGLEVGVVPLVPLPAAGHDPVLSAVPGVVPGSAPERTALGFPAAQWHQDAVITLPAGAVPLVTGDTYPHQAYRLGERAWGVQYHPEVTRSDWATWVQGGSDSLRLAGVEPASVAEVVADLDDRLEQVASAHAVAFAAVVVEFAAAGIRSRVAG
jgi:GMP synthase (glutamine-hydrolysing)